MSLINREDLIAEYDRVHVGAPGGVRKLARKLMEDAPEVDPVRKGHKINQHQYPAKWVCSECGARHFDFSDNFCSKCGADVRGEQYESD